MIPPSTKFYNLAQGENFKQFLSIVETTEDGKNAIAQHYGVLDKWTASNHEGDHVETYYKLLLLVKTKSKNDNVWISFIEGLHRHAAILTSLLCIKFDYSNNKIIPGSLQLDDFEKAQIPHYKNYGITPREQLGQIVGNHFEALMLKTPMLIQAYIPNRVANQSGATIQPLMESLKIKSDWISISKAISANKTISKLLSTWLIETIAHSTTEKRNNTNKRPKFTAMFIYQEQLTIDKYNNLVSSGTEYKLGYPTVINCAEWIYYVKNSFNRFIRQQFFDRISPSTPSSRHPTRKFTPAYGLTFTSFTDDVGVVDKKTKTCAINAGHMNGYLIIPEIVYHLSTKLQKGVTHDNLGQDTEVKLIEFLTQFGYATKKSPTVQLHATNMHYCFDVN